VTTRATSQRTGDPESPGGTPRTPPWAMRLWAGVTAIVGGLLAAGAWLPQASGAAATLLGIASAAAMSVSTLLLITALLGRRPRLGWAKLGGIALIVFHASWLAAWATPLLLGDADAVPSQAAALVRQIAGLAAATAIAARWPVSGLDRWSMFLVVAGDVLTTHGWVAAAFGSMAAFGALTLTLPLALIAFGVGHAVSGWRTRRAHRAPA